MRMVLLARGARAHGIVAEELLAADRLGVDFTYERRRPAAQPV